MNYARAFAAGFLAVLIFHQGVWAVLHLAGALPMAPYAMAPTQPLGVPQVLSSAFWGGVWGVALWPLLAGAGGKAYWIRATVLGALGPTLVALLVVFPLKGRPFAAGWDPKIWTLGLMLNGAWGFGLAWLVRILKRWF
jgi:hypothetical protein